MPHAVVVEQLGPAACRSYLVADERSREALVVDPLAEDADRLAARLERDGLALRFAVDTHTHADHVSGGRALAERTGATYALHESTKVPWARERLRNGQTLPLGDARVEVIHTPGHTPDSITLRVGNDLMTGDFLFLAQDGAGRLDFADSDAGAHWDSLRKLSSLGDECRVLPGHDYNDLTDSTLGLERRRNPRFQHVSREEYVAWQRAIALPTPDWMLDVLAANLGTKPAHEARHAASLSGLQQCATGGGTGGACTASPTGRVPLVTPREAARRMASEGGDRPFLLDVREDFEYRGPRGMHAQGARNIPLAQLGLRLTELPTDPEAEVVVICQGGGRSARAVEYLIARGRRRVFNVIGGTAAWAAEGLPLER